MAASHPSPASASAEPAAIDSKRFLDRVHPPGWRNREPKPLYDLVILGAGPAGLAAARAARAAGLTVALAERHWLGGNSLNLGSIPSKAIIRSGRAFEALINSEELGAPLMPEPVADLTAVMSRMRRIRTRIAEYCSLDRLSTEGIEVFFGEASFTGKNSLSVDSVPLRFKKALIATGARPSACDIPGLEESGYLTSASIFDIKTLPRRLAIIGGGPLGCEMAQAFAHMGSHVTILQNEPKFLPQEERDAAELLSLSLSRSGVDTRLNTQVLNARSDNGEKWIDARLNGVTYSLAVDEILLSVGRTANTEQLKLEVAGVERAPGGRVQVDDCLRTSNADVYAAGDVCMAHQFTNIAEASGRMAILNAFERGEHRCSQMIVPWCTYCDPEIAHIGMHIGDARRQSIPVKSFTVMMQDVDRAIADGRDDGFVKIHIREGTDEIIGATIVASRASEMINEIAVIMNAKVGMRQLAGILHTYPSQSDAIRLAAVAYVNSLSHGVPT
jgi:pyruvate/2-oxoglutarate dehydrogenase complex dihydrolipoamide dehydrogenase (E3) component